MLKTALANVHFTGKKNEKKNHDYFFFEKEMFFKSDFLPVNVFSSILSFLCYQIQCNFQEIHFSKFPFFILKVYIKSERRTYISSKFHLLSLLQWFYFDKFILFAKKFLGEKKTPKVKKTKKITKKVISLVFSEKALFFSLRTFLSSS